MPFVEEPEKQSINEVIEGFIRCTHHRDEKLEHRVVYNRIPCCLPEFALNLLNNFG